ncbi:glycosyltransferase family 39 protein [candidate division WOR-3 bacterium]|nr:glycosyltransferase family 39 protein [candidate division WOR-3 bacterium]
MVKKNKILFYACVIGFILRIICIFWTTSYIDPPDWEYGDIARSMVAGHGFARTAYPLEKVELTSSHAPFYPHVLAIAYSLFPNPWSFLIVQIIQTIISVFIIIIIFRTTQLLFNINAACVAALGVALYPPLVYYSMSMTPTNFSLLFLSLTVWLLLDIRHRTWIRSVFMGLSYGCALLCDPITFVLIPAAAFWFIVSHRRVTRYVLGALVLTMLVVLPWSIRNLRVHRACVPITTQFGVNFWIGNNPYATGTDYYRVVENRPDHTVFMTHTLSRTEKQKLRMMSEIKRSRYFTNKAFNYILAKPFDFVWRLVKKAFYYWWFSPSLINGSPLALRYRVPYALLYVPLLVLALFNFALFKLEQHPIDLNLILAIIIMISSVYIVTHVGLARYRIPVELYLLVMAGSSMSRLYRVFHA